MNEKWTRVRGSISSHVDRIAGTERRYREFRLDVLLHSGSTRGVCIRIDEERLQRYPHLYKSTLDAMVRDLQVWGPAT